MSLIASSRERRLLLWRAALGQRRLLRVFPRWAVSSSIVTHSTPNCSRNNTKALIVDAALRRFAERGYVTLTRVRRPGSPQSRSRRAFFAERRFASAPRFRSIPRPAPRCGAEVTADRPLAWCRFLRLITWTSLRPFGVGSTRTAESLGGLSVINEHSSAGKKDGDTPST
jgi:hypothetical protein